MTHTDHVNDEFKTVISTPNKIKESTDAYDYRKTLEVLRLIENKIKEQDYWMTSDEEILIYVEGIFDEVIAKNIMKVYKQAGWHKVSAITETTTIRASTFDSLIRPNGLNVFLTSEKPFNELPRD